ncbi:MAG TPA: hypothetical protein VNQ99_17835 [Xanthobacteraceae bacterium]|nr:hypothetical protein [Xanthobacteraceae bacterium]
MNLLFIDIESSDLPRPGATQPWIVQVAAELEYGDGSPSEMMCFRIRADGRTIRPGAQNVHGISTGMAGRSGINEGLVLSNLCGLAAVADAVVHHGKDFDRDMVASALTRLPERETAIGALDWLATIKSCETGEAMGRVLRAFVNDSRMLEQAWLRPGLEFVSTMDAATPFCRLPGTHESGGYKWPSLDEACEQLLEMEPRAGHHNAWDDVQRCKRLYHWLRDQRAFERAAA